MRYHVAKQKNWFMNRDFKIQRLDGNGTSLKKLIWVPIVFIAIIPTHLLCQM